MKTLLAAILVVALVLIRVLLWLPWRTRGSGARHPVRLNFLLVFGLVALGLIFFWFWLAMRAR